MATVIGEFVAKIDADMKGFDTGLNKADSRMGKFAKSIGKHRKAIGVGMIAIGGAIAGALGMAVKSAADFEAGMREVNTMLGLGQEEFETMSKDVLALAKDLGVNAVASTKALYQAISAGVPKENVLTFMEVATKAAIGGVTDTETAVDGLTTVINAFKRPMKDAQKIADVMFTTVKGGKTTFEELSASLFQVAPIAAASGIKFEEVAAALATMTKQGVPTTVATTQLRQAMVALQKPTADMATVINELGFESGQTMLEELGLAETLETLRVATGGSNEMLMKMFGSVEAGAAVLALTGDNAKTFAADLDAMKKASDGAGASQEAFNEIERGAARQFEKAKETIKAVAIEMGQVLLPEVTKLITALSEKLKPAIQWLSDHPEWVKWAAVASGLALIGGAILLIVPKVVALISALVVLHGLLGPAGWIKMAAGLAIAAAAIAALGIAAKKTFAQAEEIPWIGEGPPPPPPPGKRYIIPEMQHGGIVPGPIGKPMPIIAHGGERFLGAGRNGGSPTIYVTVQGSVVSERDLTEAIREQLIYLGERNTTTGLV